MTSIVIAAHNEAAVIGRCLDSLLAGADPGEFDVIVVANGCTDATADVAGTRPGVRVLDLPEPGKVAALNAGDAVAEGFPRIYLDADIVVSADGIRALRDALTAAGGPAPASAGSPPPAPAAGPAPARAGSPPPAPAAGVAPARPGSPDPVRVLAATSRRELDLSRSPLLVRAYFAINSRLPVFRNALFGRGLVALSAQGRARFNRFPDVIADDLFLDSLFSAAEKLQVESVSTRIAAPRRTADLVRRLVRVRRGNASLRAQAGRTGVGDGVRGVARTSWLRDVALREPGLMPAAACYAAITMLAATLARLPAGNRTWGRDDSSRAGDDRAADMQSDGVKTARR